MPSATRKHAHLGNPVVLANRHWSKPKPSKPSKPVTMRTPCSNPLSKRVETVSKKTGRTTFVCRPKTQKHIWGDKIAKKKCPAGKVASINTTGSVICRARTVGLTRSRVVSRSCGTNKPAPVLTNGRYKCVGGGRLSVKKATYAHVPHSGSTYSAWPLGMVGSRANVLAGRAYKTSGGLTKEDFVESYGRMVPKKKSESAKRRFLTTPPARWAAPYQKKVPIIPTTDLNNMATTSLEAVANTGTRPTAASKRAVRVQRVGTRRSARLR